MQTRAERRQACARPAAIEEPAADPAFELGKLMTDRGLRQPHPLCGASKAAGFDDGAECLQDGQWRQRPLTHENPSCIADEGFIIRRQFSGASLLITRPQRCVIDEKFSWKYWIENRPETDRSTAANTPMYAEIPPQG
jgi:hypothetical protein